MKCVMRNSKRKSLEEIYSRLFASKNKVDSPLHKTPWLKTTEIITFLFQCYTNKIKDNFIIKVKGQFLSWTPDVY